MSSLRLFGDFGPPAFRSYIDTPPKARWWSIIAAFVTGAVFVLAVRGLPQPRTEGTPTTHIYALHDRSFASLQFTKAQPEQARGLAR